MTRLRYLPGSVYTVTLPEPLDTDKPMKAAHTYLRDGLIMAFGRFTMRMEGQRTMTSAGATVDGRVIVYTVHDMEGHRLDRFIELVEMVSEVSGAALVEGDIEGRPFAVLGLDFEESEWPNPCQPLPNGVAQRHTERRKAYTEQRG